MLVVCDTAKVRFFKQITTEFLFMGKKAELFAILQKYDFSSKSQLWRCRPVETDRCLRYCKSTIFQANHNHSSRVEPISLLFAILQKYDFSSKSQRTAAPSVNLSVVCDTAKVRFFKQITTGLTPPVLRIGLFAILQKYDFSSKSQPTRCFTSCCQCCLRYCKSTIFQANHNYALFPVLYHKLFAILQKYDFSSKSQPLIIEVSK